MKFSEVKKKLTYESGTNKQMFSRIGLAHACSVDTDTVFQWEENNEIPKKYRSRVDFYIKNKIKERPNG